jgi:hypothetical protein
MSGWTVAWLFWLLMFAAIELPALVNKRRGDTLSEHVWSWFAVRDKPKGWVFRRLILILFLGWLVAHFVTGGAV